GKAGARCRARGTARRLFRNRGAAMPKHPQTNRHHRRRNTTLGLIWAGAAAVVLAFTTASVWPRVPVAEGRSASSAAPAAGPVQAAEAPPAEVHERSAVSAGEPAPAP